MFRKLIEMFTSAFPNPCADWPKLDVVTPTFDTEKRRVGDLEFGAPLSMAKSFGKPDAVEPVEDDAMNLVYARAGFQLEFTNEAFSCVAFFVAQDGLQPDLPELSFSEPVVNSRKLTSSHDAAMFENVFGVPSSVDQDDSETILYYRFGGLTVEFELGAAGKLKRVNSYPE